MLARSVVLATAIALVFTSQAFGQGRTWGGGLLQPQSDEYRPSLGISLQERSSQILLRFDTSLLCGGVLHNVSGRTQVAPVGAAITAERATVVGPRRRRLEFSWRLTATIETDSISGVLDISGRRRTARGWQGCTKRPRRPFRAVTQRTPAGAASPGPAAALLYGVNETAVVPNLPGPVIVRTNRTGGRVEARWTAAAPCSKGPRELFTNYTPPTRVRADGSFARSERFRVRYADALVRYRTRFAGRFLADGAVGVLRLRSAVFNRSGKRLRARCDSGERRWSAARPAP